MRRDRFLWLIAALTVTLVAASAVLLEALKFVAIAAAEELRFDRWAAGDGYVPLWLSQPLDALMVVGAVILALALVWYAARPPVTDRGRPAVSGAAPLALALACFALVLQEADFWPVSRWSYELYRNGAFLLYELVSFPRRYLFHYSDIVLVVALAALVRFSQTFLRRLTRSDLIEARVRSGEGLGLMAGLRRVRAVLNRVGGRFGRPLARKPSRRLFLGVMLHPLALAGVAWAFLMAHHEVHFWAYRPSDVSQVGPFLVSGYWAGEALRRLIIGVGLVGTFLLSAVYFAAQYALADEDGRSRIRWVGEGLMIVALTAILMAGISLVATEPNAYVTRWSDPVVPMLSVAIASLLFLGCLAMATFFSGAFDSDLVLRTSTLYAGTVVILTFLFAGTEELVSTLLLDHLGVGGGLATWFAAGLVALIIMPVHRRLERLIENRE